MDMERDSGPMENEWFMKALMRRRVKMFDRIMYLRRSLASLKKQEGEFAEGHRLLIAAYEDEVETLDKHRYAHIHASTKPASTKPASTEGE